MPSTSPSVRSSSLSDFNLVNMEEPVQDGKGADSPHEGKAAAEDDVMEVQVDVEGEGEQEENLAGGEGSSSSCSSSSSAFKEDVDASNAPYASTPSQGAYPNTSTSALTGGGSASSSSSSSARTPTSSHSGKNTPTSSTGGGPSSSASSSSTTTAIRKPWEYPLSKTEKESLIGLAYKSEIQIANEEKRMDEIETLTQMNERLTQELEHEKRVGKRRHFRLSFGEQLDDHESALELEKAYEHLDMFKGAGGGSRSSSKKSGDKEDEKEGEGGSETSGNNNGNTNSADEGDGSWTVLPRDDQTASKKRARPAEGEASNLSIDSDGSTTSTILKINKRTTSGTTGTATGAGCEDAGVVVVPKVALYVFGGLFVALLLLLGATASVLLSRNASSAEPPRTEPGSGVVATSESKASSGTTALLSSGASKGPRAQEGKPPSSSSSPSVPSGTASKAAKDQQLEKATSDEDENLESTNKQAKTKERTTSTGTPLPPRLITSNTGGQGQMTLDGADYQTLQHKLKTIRGASSVLDSATGASQHYVFEGTIAQELDRALTFFGRGECDKSADRLYQLLHSNLTDTVWRPKVLRNYGYTLFCSDPPRKPEALEAFDVAYRIQEQHPRWTWNLIGYIAASYGDTQNALAAFDNGLNVDRAAISKELTERDQGSLMLLNNFVGATVLRARELENEGRERTLFLGVSAVNELDSLSGNEPLFGATILSFEKLIKTGEWFDPQLAVFYDWEEY
ncbi:unnamed protein product [Amoebophrya sp. A25]|nr:unnamed protein product [Amoebophrya sp. A25]|eukprot:GSA25T00017114001.1